MDRQLRPVPRAADAGRLHTIAEVGAACGLPGPVIMQLVPRTWTTIGWMYTDLQLREAVTIAAEFRGGRQLFPKLGRPTDRSR
ncbi:hypothetical protein [Mycolicibacterium llatzerense]|uniref:hypothetical protein n=1 Tax=Mycolicibacterium llatzerense TaxID=280871 RepID=UPI001F21AED7|nr:hypothetical protein [Mycolicibacterium llatzerense]